MIGIHPRTRTHAQKQGDRGEEIACSFLIQNGYTICRRNYRVPGGEIDIVASKEGTLVFVEVKTRTSTRYGYPEESVTRTKELRLARAARAYLASAGHSPFYRFDIISIVQSAVGFPPSISHIENFFENILL